MALKEIALDASVAIVASEEAISVSDGVAATCEILGLDPLYMANEGRFAAFVPPVTALQALRAQPGGAGAACIGRVEPAPAGAVLLDGALGGRRLLDLLPGEQLPRIC